MKFCTVLAHRWFAELPVKNLVKIVERLPWLGAKFWKIILADQSGSLDDDIPLRKRMVLKEIISKSTVLSLLERSSCSSL